jgi:hypothetical protein
MAEQSYRDRALNPESSNCEPNELRKCSEAPGEDHASTVHLPCSVMQPLLSASRYYSLSTVENAIEIVVSLCHASQPTGFWTHLSPSLDSHASQPTALCTCRISLLASSRFIPTASRSLPSNAAKSSTHAAP